MTIRKYTIDLERRQVDHQTVTFVAEMDMMTDEALNRVAAAYAHPDGWSVSTPRTERTGLTSEVVQVLP
jgi:hypothetical protein